MPGIATSGHEVLRSGAQTKFPQPYLTLLPLSCNKIKVLYQNKRDKQIDHKESGGESKFTGGAGHGDEEELRGGDPVPGGLRTARGEDPLEEAAAARSWGRGENEGNEP